MTTCSRTPSCGVVWESVSATEEPRATERTSPRSLLRASNTKNASLRPRDAALRQRPPHVALTLALALLVAGHARRRLLKFRPRRFSVDLGHGRCVVGQDR